jgi:hypothetical protein
LVSTSSSIEAIPHDTVLAVLVKLVNLSDFAVFGKTNMISKDCHCAAGDNCGVFSSLLIAMTVQVIRDGMAEIRAGS